MAKKKDEITIRSSAAEYLTYVASVGDQQDSIEMRYEDESLVISDLSPLAKYLAYHSAGMLVCISGSNGHIYCAQENESLSRDADTVGKILCACSKLPQTQDDSGISAKFCNWTSQKALLPSFVLSPPSLEASALEYNYKALEETFAVCSLL